MRILPQVSQPTLDSFRKDVYRPRLALLLLILLLGGKKQVPSLEEKNTQIGNTIAHNPIQAKTLTSFISLDRIRAPFVSKRDKTSQSKKGKERMNKGKETATFVDATDTKSKAKNKMKKGEDLSSVSVLHIPRLGLQYLLRGETLSAIVPLHILWITRLAGMMIEDNIVKSPVLSQQSHSHRIRKRILTTHGAVFVRISILALIALSSLFLTSSSNLHKTMSILPLGWNNLEIRTGKYLLIIAYRITFLLKETTFTLGQLTATLLSLLSPLMKLNSLTLNRYIPRKILLPSPSHAPSMTDILPLPPGLAEVLSGRASDMQSRAGRRGAAATTLRRDPIAGVMRHGAIVAPLTLPAQSSDSLGRPKRAPRVKGLKVQVDSGWLLENIIVLWGYFVGSVEYAIVALSLPTLSPTSFPPILALLSLRSQLSALVITWTNARKSIECLEFVRRRWDSSSSRTRPRWTPDQQAEILCPICLEQIEWQKSKEESESVNVESCRLDCGHELHAVCLVQIFLGTKQAFCPCCHDALKATPPNAAVITVPPNESRAAPLDVVQ